MTAQMHLPRFYLMQQLATTTNRHARHVAEADGSVGRLTRVAQQKRMAFRSR